MLSWFTSFISSVCENFFLLVQFFWTCDFHESKERGVRKKLLPKGKSHLAVSFIYSPYKNHSLGIKILFHEQFYVLLYAGTLLFYILSTWILYPLFSLLFFSPSNYLPTHTHILFLYIHDWRFPIFAHNLTGPYLCGICSSWWSGINDAIVQNSTLFGRSHLWKTPTKVDTEPCEF